MEAAQEQPAMGLTEERQRQEQLFWEVVPAAPVVLPEIPEVPELHLVEVEAVPVILQTDPICPEEQAPAAR